MNANAAQPATDVAGLVAALDALGIACVVEARAALAVIRPDRGDIPRLASDALRREVLAQGRQHGFTHVAVELATPAADATDARAPVLRD